MIFVHPGQLDGSVSESETRTVCFQFFYRLYNYKNATNLVLTMEQDTEGVGNTIAITSSSATKSASEVQNDASTSSSTPANDNSTNAPTVPI